MAARSCFSLNHPRSRGGGTALKHAPRTGVPRVGQAAAARACLSLNHPRSRGGGTALKATPCPGIPRDDKVAAVRSCFPLNHPRSGWRGTGSIVCRQGLHLRRVWPPTDRPSRRTWAYGRCDQIPVRRCSCGMVLVSNSLRRPKLVGLREASLVSDHLRSSCGGGGGVALGPCETRISGRAAR